MKTGLLDQVHQGQDQHKARWERSAAAAILFKYRRRRLIIRLAEMFLWPLSWLQRRGTLSGLDHVRNILIFETANLGDVVCLARSLRSLRAQFPQAHVTFLGLSRVRSFLLHQKLADELIPVRVPWAEPTSKWKQYNPFSPLWPRFLWTLIRLRRWNFDLGIASGRSDIRHNLTLWLIGARRRVGYGFAGGSFLLTDVAQPDLENPHIADLTLHLLRQINVPIVQNGPLLLINADDQDFADKILAERGIGPMDQVVGVHPGTRWRARQWGEEHFRVVAHKVIERFGAKILWFVDPEQSSTFQVGPGIIPISLPVSQFLAIMSRCRLLICNEGGAMHMAAGIGIPVVAIFGPTHPEWFGPLGDQHRIVIRRDVWCRPCADRCIFEEPYCLRLIPVDRVMEAVEGVMRRFLASGASFRG